MMLVILSCDSPNVEYYPNGKISKEYHLKEMKLDGIYKEFNLDGSIKLIHQYAYGIKIDSSIFFENGSVQKIDYYKNNDTLFSVRFYPNLKKQEEGNFYKENKIGKWSYYSDDGRLEKVFEYINLNRHQYTNQGWYFNKNGDTLFNKSNFYKLKVKKSVLNPKEQTLVSISYNPLFKNAACGVLISKEKLLKDNYSNFDERNVDTLYFVDDKLQFATEFKGKGHKNLGGCILEVNKNPTPEDTYSERRVYISIPFDVR